MFLVIFFSIVLTIIFYISISQFYVSGFEMCLYKLLIYSINRMNSFAISGKKMDRFISLVLLYGIPRLTNMKAEAASGCPILCFILFL